MNKIIHFAHIKRGVVTNVILADQKFIDSGAVGNPKDWVGVYQDGYNRAGIGFIYNSRTGIFTQKRPCVFCFLVRRFFLRLLDKECVACPKK